MIKEPNLESPRIGELRAAIEAGDGAALETFWAEIERDGTPLIEPHPERPDASLVTFVWKEVAPVDSVTVIHFLHGYELSERDHLQRLCDTNLWYRTDAMNSSLRTKYRLAPGGVSGLVTGDSYKELSATWIADPLSQGNAQLFEAEEGAAPELESLLELPDAPPQPWLGRRDGVSRGTVTSHRFASAILDNDRDVFVYTPPGHELIEAAMPLLIHFDALWRERPMAIADTLDNLIAAGAIPPMVAVFIDNVDRGVELPCNEQFAKAIATELVPWMRETFNAGATPGQVATAGQSYGGLAAMWLGLQHPDVVGNVLSQSGSFWWGPDYVELEKRAVLGDAPEYEWLSGQVATRPPVPIRIWMEAGSLERAPNQRGILTTLFLSNRHMHHLLQAKGYDVTYREYVGAHDFVTWRGSLADGLIHLFGG
jgi:enterochelin esterase family protein